jgi:hypothetical protein
MSSDSPEPELPAAERVLDTERITRALRHAVRDTLIRHKRDGNPVAVWSDGRVVWIQHEDIIIPPDPDEQ